MFYDKATYDSIHVYTSLIIGFEINWNRLYCFINECLTQVDYRGHIIMYSYRV